MHWRAGRRQSCCARSPAVPHRLSDITRNCAVPDGCDPTADAATQTPFLAPRRGRHTWSMFLPQDRRALLIWTLLVVGVDLAEVVVGFFIDGRTAFFITLGGFSVSIVWLVLLIRAFRRRRRSLRNERS